MAANYVLCLTPEGTTWVLNLQPKTFAQCRSDIAWMRRGRCNLEYAVCRYVGDGAFEEVNGERRFAPDRGPYKEDAWTGFLAALSGED